MIRNHPRFSGNRGGPSNLGAFSLESSIFSFYSKRAALKFLAKLLNCSPFLLHSFAPKFMSLLIAYTSHHQSCLYQNIVEVQCLFYKIVPVEHIIQINVSSSLFHGHLTFSSIFSITHLTIEIASILKVMHCSRASTNMKL